MAIVFLNYMQIICSFDKFLCNLVRAAADLSGFVCTHPARLRRIKIQKWRKMVQAAERRNFVIKKL